MLKTFFIYVLSFAAAGVGVLYYLLIDKCNKQNLQLRILTKQNHNITAQLNSINKPTDNLKIYSKPVPFSTGQTLNRCSLYISPLSNSPILRSIPSSTRVEILDLVEAFELSWYEVKVIMSEDVNIKGFIRQELVKELQVVQTTVLSNYRR
ncbi:MAG: hypothetical protein RR891_07095 [Clostridium sp.]|uniref:hypothetical protein n=1 Tax=Clostridium sp. TaxID=1506 RepID=UPI00305F713A